MKNFITRTLTAIAYVVLLVGCTVAGPITAYMFYGLVAMACTWEFCGLMNRHYGAQLNTPIVGFASVLLSSSSWLLCTGMEDASLSGVHTLVLYGFTLLFLLVSELYRQAPDPLRNWSLSMASQVYVALPFAMLPFIAVRFDAFGAKPVYEWIYPLAIFVFLWMSDTGAYLVGSLLGRYVPYKLFPRISPNKSWVGSIGGALLTFLAAYLIYIYRPADLSLLQWLGMALVVVCFGTWGDLVESLLKRQLGIKDSGNVLPGHGGLLDRFDSALLAVPAAVLYFLYIFA